MRSKVDISCITSQLVRGVNKKATHFVALLGDQPSRYLFDMTIGVMALLNSICVKMASRRWIRYRRVVSPSRSLTAVSGSHLPSKVYH